MPDTVTLSVGRARKLILAALMGAGAARRNVTYLTEAILDTELSGLDGHGFYWLQFYCAHVRSGKVDGKATPFVKRLSAVAFRVDARNGFAHPAIEKGFGRLIPSARRHGIAGMAVHNSYNSANLGYHTGYLAKAGLVAFGFTNAFPAMAPPGGDTPVIGTNPLSFAVPGRRKGIAFLIDQSSSAVTWTAVKQAAEQGRAIPLGWALDSHGQPTTDPQSGLAGSMAPSGGHKGFGQGLIVEVMCAALAGAKLGPQMNSFINADDKPIGCGQFFIALEPETFSGGLFHKQINALIASIVAQPGARLPNARRQANRKRFAKSGLTLDPVLYEELQRYAK